MLETILVFLGASIVLYTILGGADFGAGIIEIFSAKQKAEHIENLVYKAMGPVWEANHMWAVLAVVILFNGFPAFYAELSILLHIPLTLMLIGMILRGCAFTFRHYDAKLGESARLYSFIFRYSSLLTTFFIGIIIGALARGGFMKPDSGASYWQIYWQPWLNPFCITVGMFFIVLFGYLASAFFVGEDVDATMKAYFIRWTRRFNSLAIITGLGVFIVSHFSGVSLVTRFLNNLTSLSCLFLATLLELPIWLGISSSKKWLMRAILGAQMCAIVFGWVSLGFPDFIRYNDGDVLSILDSQATSSTQFFLVLALVGGGAIILPALVYLLWVFKEEGEKQRSKA